MYSDNGLGATTPTTCSSFDGDHNDECPHPSPRSTDEFDTPMMARSPFSGAFDFDTNVSPPPPPSPRPYFAEFCTTRDYTDGAAFPASRPAVAVFSTCPVAVPSEGVGNEGVQRNYQGLDTSSDLQWQTSLMVRNLSPDLTQPEFLQHLINAGYRGLFDFIYVPMNLRACGNFGYAFVNFKSHTIAAQVMARLQSLQTGDLLSSLEWFAVWSTCQGLEANIDRYRNSPLMHPLVPKDAKPSVYDSSGILATFPAPTKTIAKPRIHRPKADTI